VENPVNHKLSLGTGSGNLEKKFLRPGQEKKKALPTFFLDKYI
jgi:hypothetical protein